MENECQTVLMKLGSCPNSINAMNLEKPSPFSVPQFPHLCDRKLGLVDLEIPFHL